MSIERLQEIKEEMMQVNQSVKKTVVEILQENICEITFRKVNGEERVMLCTLKDDLLPMQLATESKISRKLNKEVVRVYDLEKEDWRSFRIDSFLDIAKAN